MKYRLPFLAIVLILGTSWRAMALVMSSDKGLWPTTWPKELEPLRKTAKTLDMATGMQEHIYTIPFKSREEFEKIWPILAGVRTPGSPLTLSKVGKIEAGWGNLLSNDNPCVRIKGPTGGYAGGSTKPGGQIDLKELEAGTMLFAGSPWPKDLIGSKGELPEFVTAIELGDRKLKWTPVENIQKDHRGFLNRARVDIEIVTDGNIIDLNRIRLPSDASIVDRRFPDTAVSR